MDHRTSALVQAMLEGVDLPAAKGDLLAHARAQAAGEEVMKALERLPDGDFGSLDEVGEAISPVQPLRREEQANVPRAESGEPPGGRAYTA